MRTNVVPESTIPTVLARIAVFGEEPYVIDWLKPQNSLDGLVVAKEMFQRSMSSW